MIGNVERSLQARAAEHHATIQSFGVAVAKDSEIGFQTHVCADIDANGVADHRRAQPSGWMHFIEVTDPAPLRLHTPCRLDEAGLQTISPLAGALLAVRYMQ